MSPTTATAASKHQLCQGQALIGISACPIQKEVNHHGQ
jgi:hypothetical protein